MPALPKKIVCLGVTLTPQKASYKGGHKKVIYSPPDDGNIPEVYVVYREEFMRPWLALCKMPCFGEGISAHRETLMEALFDLEAQVTQRMAQLRHLLKWATREGQGA